MNNRIAINMIQSYSCSTQTPNNIYFRFNTNPEGKGSVDNPQVQGIIVAIPNGGSDKYGVSNPQGAKGKINILSSPICH